MVGDTNLGKFFCPTTSSLCDACIESEQYRDAFPNKGGKRATKPLDIMHTGMYSPMRTKSIGGGRYFIIFINDF